MRLTVHLEGMKSASNPESQKNHVNEIVAMVESEVHNFLSLLSDKSIIFPSLNEVENNTIIAIKRFRQTCRKKIQLCKEKENVSSNFNDDKNISQEQNHDSKDGLGFNLRIPSSAVLDLYNPGSPNLEGFLSELETTLFNRIEKKKESDPRKWSPEAS